MDADRLVMVGVVLTELIQAGRPAKEAEATTSRLAGLRSSHLAKLGAVHQLRAAHLCLLLLECPDRVLERATGYLAAVLASSALRCRI